MTRPIRAFYNNDGHGIDFPASQGPLVFHILRVVLTPDFKESEAIVSEKEGDSRWGLPDNNGWTKL